MTTYRLDRAPVLLVVGGVVIVAAVTGFLAFALPSQVAAVVTLVLLVAAAAFALRPPVVARLDEHGIRTRRTREQWVDVQDVSLRDGALLLALGEEGTEQRAVRVPLSAVGRRGQELVREVYDRMNTAHGYRRFE